MNFYKQTLTGFKAAMKEHSIRFDSDSYVLSAINETTAYEAARQLLNLDCPPTAIVCTVDSFAIGAMRYAKEQKLSIPRDISFIGIDDILLSRYVDPKLTTLGIDKVSMGVMAMDMLVEKIKGGNPESVLIPMELIERDSVYDLNK